MMVDGTAEVLDDMRGGASIVSVQVGRLYCYRAAEIVRSIGTMRGSCR